MSKIVEAVNSMILNYKKIYDVREYNGVFYFRFMNYIWSIWKEEAKLLSYNPYYPGYSSSEDLYKMAATGQFPSKREYNGVFYVCFMNYVWSIWKEEAKLSSYTLVYYPGYSSSEDLYKMAATGQFPSKYVSYVSSDEKTNEATESFIELYRVVNEKLYNLESVLDNIISLIDDSDGVCLRNDFLMLFN
jgi:hypothetical protein